MANLKDTEIITTIEAGRLVCGRIRDFLNGCKFQGMEINFIESTGFLFRVFTIKGSKKDIFKIMDLLGEVE